jgi:Flp pilus assembly protein TadB
MPLPIAMHLFLYTVNPAYKLWWDSWGKYVLLIEEEQIPPPME